MNAFGFRNNQVLFFLSGRRFTSQPFVKRRTSDFQLVAQHFNWPAISMLFDELKPQPFSLAKKAVAFFKMARSIFS